MEECRERSQMIKIVYDEILGLSFVSHLSDAFRRGGISILDQETEEGVRVSVVIFSESCDFTTSFVDKFVKERGNDHVVVPVFYGVDPSDVNLGNLEVGNLIYNQSKGREFELVKEIVREVHRKLSPTERIGTDLMLMEIENLLCEQPWKARMIGIWGMAGTGKSTLVKAMFNKVSSDYDASAFIKNFDEEFRQGGRHGLVKKIISEVVKEKFDKISSSVTRPNLLRDELFDTRIIIVLDNVGDPLAAESVLGRLDWLGPGSLIIMTSMDKQVFAFCQVNQIYEVHDLNKHEALQLFSQIAFGKDMPDPNDMELSMKVIDYANGNPLALRTYGQELKGKESEMGVDFLKLKQCPPLEIQNMLKNPFNALSDNVKNIFVDIACFFRGENVDYVVQLLEGCRYFPRVGIDVLADKCLVAITDNTVQMNILIQNLLFETRNGETIQGERCTRLWELSSIRYLLEDDESEANRESKATPERVLVAEDIESILLDTSNLTFNFKPDAFKSMFNLRFLKIYSSCSKHVPGLIFPRGLDSLPYELRLLHWENYPLQSLPRDFNFGHLVELNMPYSQLQNLWERTEKLEKLKRIRLCHSQYLVEFDIIPLCAPNLELIDLQGCKRLQIFADASQSQHLRAINLSGCTEIKSFPAVPLNIEELHLQGTHIEEIPISIITHFNEAKLDRKKLLNLVQDFPADATHNDLESLISLIKVSSHIQGLSKLVHLNMRDSSLLLCLPDMSSLESLQVLDLSGCSKLTEIKSFPINIKKLYIAGTAIRELPQLPHTLESLNAHGCKHLKSVLLNFERLPRHYTFSNCVSLSSRVVTEFLMKGLTRVARLATEQHQELIKTPEFSICIPTEVYKNFSFPLQEGSNVMIDLDRSTRHTLSGFAMGVVVYFRDNYRSSEGLGIRCECTWKAMNGHLEKIVRIFQCWAPMEAPLVVSDHIFIFYNAKIHLTGKDLDFTADNVTFKFYTVSGENEVLDNKCMVTKCGVQMIKASTDEDKSVCEITRSAESSSTVEECLYSVNHTHKLLPKGNKVKSKRNMFFRFLSCARLVKTI